MPCRRDVALLNLIFEEPCIWEASTLGLQHPSSGVANKGAPVHCSLHFWGNFPREMLGAFGAAMILDENLFNFMMTPSFCKILWFHMNYIFGSKIIISDLILLIFFHACFMKCWLCTAGVGASENLFI